jgi:hypothetical protein
MTHYIITRPARPEALIAWAVFASKHSLPSLPDLSNGEKGAIIGHLTGQFTQNGRYAVLEKLFNKNSTRDLSAAEWQWLKLWLSVSNVDEKWLPCDFFFVEAIHLAEYINQE